MALLPLNLVLDELALQVAYRRPHNILQILVRGCLSEAIHDSARSNLVRL